MSSQLMAGSMPGDALANAAASSGATGSSLNGCREQYFEASPWLIAKVVMAPVAGTVLVFPTIQSFIAMSEPPGSWPSLLTAGGVHDVSGVNRPWLTE